MIDSMKVYCSCVGSTLRQPLPTRLVPSLSKSIPCCISVYPCSCTCLRHRQTCPIAAHQRMDNPTEDITQVVHTLCQGTPDQQTKAINTYFTPNASFTHPFCRTGSFDGSRNLIHAIYKWYKLLSPKIELNVNSIGRFPSTQHMTNS